MKDQIIVISDIHANGTNRQRLNDKFTKLPSIVGIRHANIENLYVIFAGDIANTGLKEEYEIILELAEKFKRDVEARIKGINVHFLCVPGNHDVNLANNHEVLLTLLKSEEVFLKLPSDFFRFYVERLNAYFEFSEKLTGETNHNKICKNIHKENSSNYSIGFKLYNTAIYSDNDIKMGYMKYPLEMLENNEDTARNHLVFAVMHHPLEWFEINNRRELRDKICPGVDCLITGHEHLKRYDNRMSNEYVYKEISTLAFDDPNARIDNGVTSIYIEWDSNPNHAQFSALCHLWKDYNYILADSIEEWDVPLKIVGCRNKIAEAFRTFLNELPFRIIHPNVQQLSLPDIFIYPHLHRGGKLRKKITLSSKELLNINTNGSYHIIVGSQKSGKTCLAKKLFLDLLHSGKIPVFLDYAEIGKDSFENFVNESYKKQYPTRDVEHYWSHSREQMAIIIDNYNPSLKDVSQYVEELKTILSRMSFAAITLNSDYYLNFSQDDDFKDLIATDYSVYEIAELNHSDRHHLISKWYSLDRDAPPLGSPDATKEIFEIERVITVMFGHSIVPKFPMYVSLFLQVMVDGGIAHNSDDVGTYGSLYELVIKTQLAKYFGKTLPDVLNFLSEFCYYLYVRNGFTMYFSEQDYTLFANEFNDSYGTEYRPITILKKLTSAGVIIKHIGEKNQSFVHEYFYYYFIAVYLDKHSDEPEVNQQIHDLCVNFYDVHQANIWLFLTHISNKKVVVSTLLNYANSILADIPEVEFEADLKFVEQLRRNGTELHFHDDKYEVLQEKRYASEDRREEAEQELQSPKGLDSTDTIEPVVQFVQATKAVDALGQLLRNFIGELKTGPKQELLETAYRLTCRTINYFLAGMISAAQFLIKKLKEETPEGLSEEKITSVIDDCSTYIYYFLLAFSYTNVHRVATAVAHPMLKKPYGVVKGKLPDTVSFTLIQATVDLYVNQNPDTFLDPYDLQGLYKSVFCRELIQTIVFHYMYMYIDDSNLKQKLCSKYKIGYSSLVQAQKLR